MVCYTYKGGQPTERLRCRSISDYKGELVRTRS